MYADVRASEWEGPTGGLRRLLVSRPQVGHRRWQTVLQHHPAPTERRQVLDDTRPLFSVGFWEAFATGVAATIAFPSTVFSFSNFIPPPWDIWCAVLLFAPLTIGVVGIGVWRAAVATLMQQQMPRGMGRLGLGLGLVL